MSSNIITLSPISICLGILLIALYLFSLYYNRKYRQPPVFDSSSVPKKMGLSSIISRRMMFMDKLIVYAPVVPLYYFIKETTIGLEHNNLIAIFVALFIGPILGSRLIKVLKLWLTNHFNITVLRTFEKSQGMRVEILPTLGSYGRINMISDIGYMSSHVAGDEYATNVFSQFFELKISTDNEWKNTVENFILESNLIVFYLSEPPSVNIRWEMDKVKELKKDDKTLILIKDNIYDSLMSSSVLDSYDFKYILPYSFYANFRSEFHSFVRELYNL